MFSQHYMGLVFASLALLQPGDAKVTDDEWLWVNEIQYRKSNMMKRYTFAITTEYSDSTLNLNREYRNSLVCELSACYTIAKKNSKSIGSPMHKPAALQSWEDIEKWSCEIGKRLGKKGDGMDQLRKDIQRAVATKLSKHLVGKEKCTNCETYPSETLQKIYKDSRTKRFSGESEKRKTNDHKNGKQSSNIKRPSPRPQAQSDLVKRLRQAAAAIGGESKPLQPANVEQPAEKKSSKVSKGVPLETLHRIFSRHQTAKPEEAPSKHKSVSEQKENESAAEPAPSSPNKQDSEKKVPLPSIWAASTKIGARKKGVPQPNDKIRSTDGKGTLLFQTLIYKKGWVGKLGTFNNKQMKWNVTWEEECVGDTNADKSGYISPEKFEVIEFGTD